MPCSNMSELRHVSGVYNDWKIKKVFGFEFLPVENHFDVKGRKTDSKVTSSNALKYANHIFISLMCTLIH